MATRIRAIYESGQLRLLDKVDLAEGQEVEISIQSVDELKRLKVLIGDLVEWSDPNANPNPEVEQDMDEIDHALRGHPLLSEIIIEERGEW